MGMNKKNRPKGIAPRLADGCSRVSFGSRLPEEIKEGLRNIARTEAKSMSWVMEEVIIKFFRLPKPEYVRVTAKRKR